MPHTGNNGNSRLKNSPHNWLFIKGPQVFDGATTTTDDQDIEVRPIIGLLDIGDNFLGSSLSLYLGWKKENLHARKAPRNSRDNIANNGPTLTGNNPNFLGELGDSLFELLLKKAFFLEFLFQLLKLNS